MPKANNKTSQASYYSKRPLWQWIVLYLVIGGLVYLFIYYFLFANKGSKGGTYNYGVYNQSSSSGQPKTSTPSNNPYSY